MDGDRGPVTQPGTLEQSDWPATPADPNRTHPAPSRPADPRTVGSNRQGLDAQAPRALAVAEGLSHHAQPHPRTPHDQLNPASRTVARTTLSTRSAPARAACPHSLTNGHDDPLNTPDRVSTDSSSTPTTQPNVATSVLGPRRQPSPPKRPRQLSPPVDSGSALAVHRRPPGRGRPCRHRVPVLRSHRAAADQLTVVGHRGSRGAHHRHALTLLVARSPRASRGARLRPAPAAQLLSS
jgi:hypothetical protein